MTEPQPSSHGRSTLGGSHNLGLIRIGIGLVQGLLLFALYRSASAEPMTWPASQPMVFGALCLAVSLAPMVLLSGLGRLSIMALSIWAVVAAGVLALLGGYDVLGQSSEYYSPPFMEFPVVAFSAAALFIAHHLIVPAVTAKRWFADFDDYFDTAWKAGVQLALSLGFTLAFWLLLFLGSALFKVIGLSFLQDLISRDWFAIPITCLAFAIAVHLTDVRATLIRGVRTVVLMLLSWLLLVITVLVTGFLLALPFTGMSGLWETGSATAMVLTAAAALIILINTAYQDGHEDNLPPAVLRIAVRVASLLLIPLMAIAFWGLALRIEQHGLTPDRIIACACTLVGCLYAGGYSYASLKPLWRRMAWMKPLEITNVAAAVLALALILALFSPLLDPARLSVHDQIKRLERGAVSAEDFDYNYLRFHAGKAGERGLITLAASNNPTIAAKAKAAQAYNNSQINLYANQTDLAATITSWPQGTSLPASFVEKVNVSDPRQLCTKKMACLATARDMNGDGKPEILLASAFNIILYHQTEAGWVYIGYYRDQRCNAATSDHRELLKSPSLSAQPSPWPDLAHETTQLPFLFNQTCP